MFKPGDKVLDINRPGEVFTVQVYKPNPNKIVVHDTIFHKDGRYIACGTVQLRPATKAMQKALELIYNPIYN